VLECDGGFLVLDHKDDEEDGAVTVVVEGGTLKPIFSLRLE